MFVSSEVVEVQPVKDNEKFSEVLKTVLDVDSGPDGVVLKFRGDKLKIEFDIQGSHAVRAVFSEDLFSGDLPESEEFKVNREKFLNYFEASEQLGDSVDKMIFTEDTVDLVYSGDNDFSVAQDYIDNQNTVFTMPMLAIDHQVEGIDDSQFVKNLEVSKNKLDRDDFLLGISDGNVLVRVEDRGGKEGGVLPEVDASVGQDIDVETRFSSYVLKTLIKFLSVDNRKVNIEAGTDVNDNFMCRFFYTEDIRVDFLMAPTVTGNER